MKPSEQVIDKVSQIFGVNTPLVVDCFEESLGKAIDVMPVENKQPMANMMFSAFVDGMMTAMHPGSKFNKEYKNEGHGSDGGPGDSGQALQEKV